MALRLACPVTAASLSHRECHRDGPVTGTVSDGPLMDRHSHQTASDSEARPGLTAARPVTVGVRVTSHGRRPGGSGFRRT
jgi:hypothetical protein